MVNPMQNAFSQFQQAQPQQQTAMTQPRPQVQQPTGGLASLPMYQQFGQGGYGGFGGQNQQYHQQMQDWRGQRPEHERGMDHDAFRQQMDAWRGQRPDRNAMPQPGMPQQMPLQQAPLSGGAPQQAALQNAYQDFLAQKQFGSAIPAGGTPAQLTPQQIQSMQGALGLFAGAGGQPQVGTAAQQPAQDSLALYSRVMNLAGAQPSAPTQAVMPPAPNTQQIAQAAPRMQAMRNMQQMGGTMGGINSNPMAASTRRLMTKAS